MNQVPPMYRSSGATAAERYLKKLCDRSFLSLWSYSGVYRDQGKVGKAGDGKEICDLLVVFQNHILIFSDKERTQTKPCPFGSTSVNLNSTPQPLPTKASEVAD